MSKPKRDHSRLDHTLDSVLGVPEGPNPWVPLVPAEGEETVLVCAACFSCDVEHDHQCFDPLVSAPNEDGAVLIEVAVADLPMWYEARCRWLASQLVSIADRAETYATLAEMLLEGDPAERQAEADPTLPRSAWASPKGEA
jgi:hypothetical protein